VSPSPTRISALSNLDLARNLGKPAAPFRAFAQRKKAANALSSRRNTCCSVEKLNRASRSSAARTAFSSAA